jgi:hypothetical protein
MVKLTDLSPDSPRNHNSIYKIINKFGSTGYIGNNKCVL